MKRKHHEEHANHEAWAIPYADLLTLLLALFVVMYAVSVVNTGKYKVMSESMYEAFNGTPRSIVVISPHQDQGHDNSVPIPQLNLPRPQVTAPPITPLSVARVNPIKVSPYNSLYPVPLHSLTDIADQLRKSVQPLIDKKLIIVRKVQNWLEIEIRSDILYPSGQAVLSPTADSTLIKLAKVLSGFDNALRIEGYTDDQPIDTSTFPSNWELSAARSASVARLFSANGIKPERMSILGWGQYHPIADNATAAGRNLNRRVVIVVLSSPDAPAPVLPGANI
ncbi:flagellar motor protein MotD [Frateuria aurantia]